MCQKARQGDNSDDFNNNDDVDDKDGNDNNDDDDDKKGDDYDDDDDDNFNDGHHISESATAVQSNAQVPQLAVFWHHLRWWC